MLKEKGFYSPNLKATLPQTIRLGELATAIDATLQGNPNLEIKGIGSLAHAKENDVSFLAGAKYKPLLKQTKASAVILTKEDVADCPSNSLITTDPKLAFAKMVQLLFKPLTICPEIHPTAVIGEGCEISPLSYIGPYCIIGNRVKIGPRVVLQAHCFVGDDSAIDEGTLLYSHATVYAGCQIGKEGVIHSGCVIGGDGFGFAKEGERWLKVPQIGGVKIGDRVEIGANTTIDRGAIDDTEIGDDVILDNLIQIGHNVKIGQGTAMAACSGIAGSTTIGKHCLIGGGSRINGHITITDFVTLVGCTNVAKSILEAGVYASGISENNFKSWRKNLARFHQLDELANRLITLEKKVEAIEEG